ncbi:hypothetical protein IKE82_02225 [Candidatus Saccharibacteria bacterium]|nr:hypothetical protein [Candidatus Saccharibacteria bacterium]
MQKKSLLENLQDKINEYVGGLNSLLSNPINNLKYRLEARKTLGIRASSAEVSALEYRLIEQAKEEEVLASRRQNYYLRILSGLIDMIEAVVWRYDGFKEEMLTKDLLDALSELFYSGKRTLLMYSRWLCVIEEDTFVEGWPDLIEPVNLDTFKTAEAWFDFFDSLPQ